MPPRAAEGGQKRASHPLEQRLQIALHGCDPTRIMFLGWEMLRLLNRLLCKNEMQVWSPSTHGKNCVRPC
ncbi:hypothetical protein LEMLEM_LOCUS3755 [Lemmus lemmus]